VNLAAVILAAGAGKRLGGQSKALLRVGNEYLADRMTRIFEQAGVRSIYLVLRDAALAEKLTRPCNVVINPNPEHGQFSSLQCGLRAASDCEAVFFTPVDYPALQASTPAELVAAWRSDDDVIAPEFEGKHGHPVLMSAAHIPRALGMAPTATARDLLSQLHLRNIPVGDCGILHDVDTPEDLSRHLEVSR
jgi:nicotine blue oxidoreductase